MSATASPDPLHRTRHHLRAAPGEIALGHPQAPEGEYNWSNGVVHDIAYLGGHSVYYIKLDSGKMVQAFFANSATSPDLPDLGGRGLHQLGR